MAGRGRTSYQKKMKEQARMEKRQEKAARLQARRESKPENSAPDDDLQSAAEYLQDDFRPAGGH